MCSLLFIDVTSFVKRQACYAVTDSSCHAQCSCPGDSAYRLQYGRIHMIDFVAVPSQYLAEIVFAKGKQTCVRACVRACVLRYVREKVGV